VVKGQVGFAPLPGGDQYWDYEKGEWVTPESGVNEAPFIAFGGWVIGVAADSDVKEAAFDFAAFMARPEMVKVLAVTGGTGINPSRFSQFEDIDRGSGVCRRRKSWMRSDWHQSRICARRIPHGGASTST
jgi:multiple sugar transport system substrate-binding protein